MWFKEILNNWLSPTKKIIFFTFQELYTNIVAILNANMTSVKRHCEIQEDDIMWNYWININSTVSRASATFLKGQKWEANAVSIFSFKMEGITPRSFIVVGITSIKAVFLFRKIPLTLHKSKPRAIRFEVSTYGSNEKRNPCMSAMSPSLGINSNLN